MCSSDLIPNRITLYNAQNQELSQQSSQHQSEVITKLGNKKKKPEDEANSYTELNLTQFPNPQVHDKTPEIHNSLLCISSHTL